MTIYKHKDTGKLYIMHRCRGMKTPGYWYEATPYNRHDKNAKALTSHRQLNKLEPVAYR